MGFLKDIQTNKMWRQNPLEWKTEMEYNNPLHAIQA